MRSASLFFSLLLTGTAAFAAWLVLAPAPTRTFANLAVVVDEKSVLVLLAAIVGGALAVHALPYHRLGPVLALLLAGFAGGVALIPPAQAMALARRRGVSLSWWRYLRAPVDIGPARPHQTLTFAEIDGTALALDVYRPPAAEGPVSAIIVIHGGGWSTGDKGETPLASERLAAAGYAVFDVQYRLGPPPHWRA